MQPTAAPPKITPASRLGQVEEYYFSKKLREIAQLRAAGHRVLNLAIGSPDLPPHPDVIATLNTVAQQPDVHGYAGYRGLPELRRAFARFYQTWYGVVLDAETEVLPLIGSKEGIVHISMTYLEAGDEVLVPNPGYPAYAAAGQLTGATVRPYDLTAANGWLPDLEALAATDLSRVKLMWVNYPNMPTGTAAPAGFFERLVAFARTHHLLLVNDNPYSFILNDAPASLLATPGAREVALELNSLSKSHNLAGWRVGALLGRADRLEEVLRFKSNVDSGMFRGTQHAAVTALELGADWFAQLNATYRTRRDAARMVLEQLGCTVRPGQVGMFLWGRTPDAARDAFALADRTLADHDVFITPGGIFGTNGARYLRISLCSPVALFEEALERLRGGK